MTGHQQHLGLLEARQFRRAVASYLGGPPEPPKIPTNSWINPPDVMEAIAQQNRDSVPHPG